MSAMHSRFSWPVACAFVVLSPAFYPGAWLGRAPARGDVPTQFIPWNSAVRDALMEGELPFWNPYTFCGAPLLANMQSAVLYPLDLLLLPLPPGRAYGLSLALHALLAMAGAYLLARKLGANRDAAFLPAIAYAYCGWNAIHLFAGNLLNLFACAWVPWLWLTLLLPAWRRLAATAGVVAMMVLCGYPQTLAHALALGLLFQLLVNPSGRTQRWRDLGLSLVGIFWGLLLSAVQLGPTLAYLLQSGRSQPLPWSAATEFSLAPSHLICFLAPHWFGNQADGTYVGHWWDWSNPYASVAVVILAGVALFSLERKRALPLAAVALLTLLLSMGRYSVLYRLYYHVVPLADRFRAPVRFLPFTILALSLLAALGWSRMSQASRRTRIVLTSGGGIMILGAGALLNTELSLHPDRDAAWMLLLLGCTLWVLALRTWRWSGALLVVLVTTDLAMLNRSFYGLGDADAATASLARAFAATPAGPEQPRVLTPPMRGGLHNLAIPARHPNFSGYDPLYPGRFGEFVKELSRSCDLFEDSADTLTFPMRHGADLTDCTAAWSRLALFNVKYAYSRRGMIELPALPRAWISHWVEATSSSAIRRQLFDLSQQRPGPRRYVATTSDTSATVAAEESQATLRRYTFNRVEIEAHMAAAGVLVLADNWAPGWRVSVDGERRPLIAAWEFLRAVHLDAGTHHVVFRYTPPGWTPGWITSLVAGIAWIGTAVRCTKTVSNGSNRPKRIG
ncbi:YfhO family protein [bacterium]|nr:YfhO family protein [bacterium]